jgi:rRNA biogenesis protein RRP5
MWLYCACAAGGVAPPLTQLFSVGQYVRCIIKDLGSSDGSSGSNSAAANGSSSSSKKRITASLRLRTLLSGVSGSRSDAGGGYFAAGQVVPAVVTSIEDRGYALSFGVKVSHHLSCHLSHPWGYVMSWCKGRLCLLL